MLMVLFKGTFTNSEVISKEKCRKPSSKSSVGIELARSTASNESFIE